jgi:putative hydrolase of the HAD superfamily
MSRSSSRNLSVTASKAIIFDLDDTLYAERDYVLSGFRAVADWSQEVWQVPPEITFRELVQLLDEGRRGNTFNMWLQSRNLDTSSAIVETMVDIYRGHEPEISIASETREILAELRRDGYQLGLVSDGYLRVQQKKFAALDVDDLFQAVVFSDQFGREHWKPSTKPFKEVLRLLNVSQSNAVYVADNPAKDFIGPSQMGMKTIRIRLPGGLHHSSEAADPAAKADIEISDLQHIKPHLDHIF